MPETNYEREMAAIQVPNLTGKTETSHDQHFGVLKAGEIAASHTQYAGGELIGYGTVQNSSMFGANLMLEAVKKVGVDGDLVKAMLEIVDEAGIPFSVGEGEQNAA